MSFTINNLIAISLFFLMGFPGLYIKLGAMLRVPAIIGIFTLFIILIYNSKSFVHFLKKSMHNKILFCMLCWFLWIVVTGLYFCLKGTYPFPQYINAILFRFIPLIYITFYFAYSLSNCCLIKKYAKFLIIILFIGLLDFVIFSMPSNIFQSFYLHFVVNNRTIFTGECIKAYSSVFPRIQATFDEPSFYAAFLCINIPLVFHLTVNKIKIFKNNIFNKAMPYILPLLMIFNIIGTFSPVFIIFAIIIFLYCYNQQCKIFSIKRLWKTLLISLGIIVIFTMFSDIISNIQIISRIKIFMENNNNFSYFVLNSTSLANRIVSYINLMVVFIQHPILGVGFGNIDEYLLIQYMHSPVPITAEIRGYIEDWHGKNVAIFYHMLAETGIIGCGLLYTLLFLVKHKISKLLKKATGIDYVILLNLNQTWLVLFLLTFYNSMIAECYIWGVLGIMAGYHLQCSKRRKHG